MSAADQLPPVEYTREDVVRLLREGIEKDKFNEPQSIQAAMGLILDLIDDLQAQIVSLENYGHR